MPKSPCTQADNRVKIVLSILNIPDVYQLDIAMCKKWGVGGGLLKKRFKKPTLVASTKLVYKKN